ncbi:hypothetical protein [Frankia sp. EAN1pec]|uniref:hypothetical protein n=1 Tax=Parafrankia sp. (strain EAN1pec) TaxID=298653 RepID=UPI0002FC2F49
MRSRGTTTERGYGYAHRRERARRLPSAWGTPCTRCGQALVRGQEIHLDHTEDRTGYLGFAHARCNRLAGASKGGRASHRGRRRTRTTPPPVIPPGRPSRDW